MASIGDELTKEALLNLTPCANWTDDCQGKQDYDGRIIYLSTRYWPGEASGHGTMTFNTATRQFGTKAYGKYPSAHVSILLHSGPRGVENDTEGTFYSLKDAEFEAPTEAEVKKLVEEWATQQIRSIVLALRLWMNN